MDYKVDEIVKWCWTETHPNTYRIVSIEDDMVLLKQNFGIKTILKDRIKISEIKK